MFNPRSWCPSWILSFAVSFLYQGFLIQGSVDQLTGARTESQRTRGICGQRQMAGSGCPHSMTSLHTEKARCPQFSVTGLLMGPRASADHWPPRCHLGERGGGRQCGGGESTTSSITWKKLGHPKRNIKRQVVHLSFIISTLAILAHALKKFKPIPGPGFFFLRTFFLHFV